MPCCTALHVSKGAKDVAWHVRVSLKNEWFLLFPRGERSTRRHRHPHTKSISRWVSGNSFFNYNSPPSWTRGRVCRLAMRRLKWHTGKGSPWGGVGARRTTGDAGEAEGWGITRFPQCSPCPTWRLPRSDLASLQSGRPVPLLTRVSTSN